MPKLNKQKKHLKAARARWQLLRAGAADALAAAETAPEAVAEAEGNMLDTVGQQFEAVDVVAECLQQPDLIENVMLAEAAAVARRTATTHDVFPDDLGAEQRAFNILIDSFACTCKVARNTIGEGSKFAGKYNDHMRAVWAAVRAVESSEKEDKKEARKNAERTAADQERARERETIRRPLWVRLREGGVLAELTAPGASLRMARILGGKGEEGKIPPALFGDTALCDPAHSASIHATPGMAAQGAFPLMSAALGGAPGGDAKEICAIVRSVLVAGGHLPAKCLHGPAHLRIDSFDH